MSQCASVGCKSNKRVVEHHISYDPEVKVPLCVDCHGKIHHSWNPLKNPMFIGKPKTLVLAGLIIAYDSEHEKAFIELQLRRAITEITNKEEPLVDKYFQFKRQSDLAKQILLQIKSVVNDSVAKLRNQKWL